MSRVVWRPLCLVMILLLHALKHKHAANVGGKGFNELQVESTTPEVTTSRGLLVSGGPVNFTVQSGTKVTLHCRVDRTDKNASVSWLKRKGDSLELISVGLDVFNHDQRYKINYIQPLDWQLYIQPVNHTDQGYYECQVSSHPPVLHSVFLHVLEDHLEIANLILTTELPVTADNGSLEHLDYSTTTIVAETESEVQSTTTEGTEITQDKESVYQRTKVPELNIADERNHTIKNKFYNSGSTIELRCVIVKVPTPTQFIMWKHNSTILNYDTSRGGISVKTDILPDGAKSQLYIANVGPSDSGNYSCSLGEETLTWVSVVVITGETPAAMQHGSATAVNVGLLTLLSAALSALS